MKLRYKITSGLLIFAAMAITTFAVVLSYNSECKPYPVVAGDVDTMKAIVHVCYGPPDDLQYTDIEKPTPGDDEVLVKIHSAAVNPLDYHYMRGLPYMVRLMASGIGSPGNPRLGVDFAGSVEAIGNNVKHFKIGDEVFGTKKGAYGEYVTRSEDRGIVLKPENVTFEEGATVGIAAVTALQALRDKGKLKPGQKVLINGASGGVGTFAVQIAKAFGAEVSGVCSTRNVEMVRSIGADHVFDYKKEDYTKSGQRFDLIIDNVGNHSLLANRKALNPGGTLVIVGGSKTGKWIGPLMRPLWARILTPFVDENFVPLLAKINQDDLLLLANLMQEGKVKPVIDRRYKLSEVPDAIRYSETGRARGKIIINVEQDL